MTHVRKLLFLGSILLFGQLSIAQESNEEFSYVESYNSSKRIEGYVFVEDSTILIGATIKISGTSIGTYANFEGYFEQEVTKEHIGPDSLEISYITIGTQYKSN